MLPGIPATLSPFRGSQRRPNRTTSKFEFLGPADGTHLEMLPNLTNRRDSGMALGKQLASGFGRSSVHSAKGQAINIHLPTSIATTNLADACDQ